MATLPYFFVIGKVAVSFSVPKSLEKDDVDTLVEDPGYVAAYSIEFSASPDSEYALQALPLYPKFFQGSASGSHENGVVQVEFDGCFRIPVNSSERGMPLFEKMMKEGGNPLVLKVMWGNTICPLLSHGAKKVSSLQTNATISSKVPNGVKFPR